MRCARKLTIDVHNREDVKVILVEKALCCSVGACEESISKVLDHHGSNPFSGMNGAVQDNGRIDARLASSSPEVNASNGIAVQRRARGDNLRSVGELRMQVVEELKVVCIGMV